MAGILALLEKIAAVGFGCLLLLFVGWVIKRRFIDKKPIPSGVENATRAHLMNLMNEDQRAALEHQMYMEEEESREDDQGTKK